MLYLNMSSNLQGVHKYGYVPSIQAANPVKPDKDKDDWWNEMCKKHGAKNHFPKDKSKKDKSDE